MDQLLKRHFDSLDDAARAAVDIVLTAYRSMLGDIAYVSSPITGGRRFYDALMRHGARDAADLAAKSLGAPYGEVIAPNIREVAVFSESVRERVNGSRSGLQVVSPSVFEAKKQRWGQHDYMYLWLRVLGEKAKEIHLIDGWEYSDGSTEEFVYGTWMQFKFTDSPNTDVIVYDHLGDEMRLDRGARLIAAAICRLRGLGFEPEGLVRLFRCLYGIHDFLHEDGLTDASEYHRHFNPRFAFDREAVRAAYKLVCPKSG